MQEKCGEILYDIGGKARLYRFLIRATLRDLMDRVRRCMVLTGLRTFTSFAHSSLTLKCQATEREHGVDAVGTPVRPSKEYPLDRP